MLYATEHGHKDHPLFGMLVKEACRRYVQSN